MEGADGEASDADIAVALRIAIPATDATAVRRPELNAKPVMLATPGPEMMAITRDAVAKAIQS